MLSEGVCPTWHGLFLRVRRLAQGETLLAYSTRRSSVESACICDKDGRIRKHGDNRPTIALTEESLKDVDADCKDFASNPVDHQKLLEIAERYPRRAAQADADCYATKQ